MSIQSMLSNWFSRVSARPVIGIGGDLSVDGVLDVPAARESAQPEVTASAQCPVAAPRLEVEILEAADGATVRLWGEAGIQEAAILDRSLAALGARRVNCVTFDFSELAFISSLAMDSLVAFRRSAIRRGCRVRLAPGTRSTVLEAMERAEILSLFEVADGQTAGGNAGARDLRSAERHYGITWAQLVELEPGLATLLHRARSVGAQCSSRSDAQCALAAIRKELRDLVGFTSHHESHPVLGSRSAYEVADSKLHAAVAEFLTRRSAEASKAAPAN